MSEITSGKTCCPPLTRREARREERREAILDVAAGYFLEHGYAGTTMSGIAAALGGSKGTLWNYYASKDLLFADVLERATREFRAQLSLALNPDEPVAAALGQFCSRYLGRLTNPNSLALHRLVMGEVGRFPEVGRIFYERAPRMVHQLLADFLGRAMDHGELRRADPFEAAQFLTALCMARSHLKLLAGVVPVLKPAEAEADARAAIDVFLRAYS
jgi:TetR/AcrR family transcriptional regulator, mexJK operon transcriptional repressor